MIPIEIGCISLCSKSKMGNTKEMVIIRFLYNINKDMNHETVTEGRVGMRPCDKSCKSCFMVREISSVEKVGGATELLRWKVHFRSLSTWHQ